VTIVTSDLAAVDDRPTRPTHATAAGGLRVVVQELPWLSRRSIDVASDAPANAIAPAIVREVIADSADRDIALRGRHRWVRCY
jgi:phthiocerol/phenolphthiocerol synthesis type-I polyketide synthase E